MSNDVQSHEEVAERAAGDDRRGSARHAAGSLGSVTARIIGGSQVELVNFSSRGVLFECDSRLLIGARASVRITTADTNLIVTGRVVRSRVKGLVNGALRYDAALVLDSELTLAPGILAVMPAAADDMVAFESDVEDPTAVEAYVAESEASLLEVAGSTELPIEDAMASVAAVVALENSPIAEDAPAADAAPAEAEPDAVDAVAFEAVAFEAVAFEADADIAFEPSADFVFDEPAAEPVEAGVEAALDATAGDEPAGASMFDATYIPPSDEADVREASPFVVTPPMPAPEQAASSFFDARPSATFARADGTVDAGAAVAAVDVAVDTEVAFEAEDTVLFEAAFDDAPEAFLAAPATDIEAIDVRVSVSLEPMAADAAAAALPDTDAAAVAPPPPLVDRLAAAPEGTSDTQPDAPPDAEDRVLLQFAATVPRDLADLRRIAADNQW